MAASVLAQGSIVEEVVVLDDTSTDDPAMLDPSLPPGDEAFGVRMRGWA